MRGAHYCGGAQRVWVGRFSSNLFFLEPEALTASSGGSRRQPYSAYAVHLTTLSPPAILGDAALICLLWTSVQAWPETQKQLAMYSLLVWMFVSKFIKNVGHYARYPSDIALLPVSIVFGWFHGLIKLYAMFTLNVVRTPLHLFLLSPIGNLDLPTNSLLLSHGKAARLPSDICSC